MVQDVHDSARLDIDASGHWSRALWITRYHDGVRCAPRAEQEHGTWQVTDSAYLFTDAVSGRTFALAALPADGDLILPLRATQDGYIETRLRTVQPASPVGAWRMARVRARLRDHGVWTLLGAQLHFESNYLQNHRFGGTTLAVGGTQRSVLALQRGLSHDDEPVPVRYERVDTP